jgi:ATP-dependent protease HslVU (ClpYQ) peptidase subunit
MSKHGTCCAVIITEEFVVCGCDSYTSGGFGLLKPVSKITTLTDGAKVLSAGGVGPSVLLLRELEAHRGEFGMLNKDSWLLDGSGEAKCQALLVTKELRVFDLSGPFEACEIQSPGYYAIGSGSEYALGVIWAALAGKKNVSKALAEKTMRTALLAACALDESCNEPIFIETMEVE